MWFLLGGKGLGFYDVGLGWVEKSSGSSVIVGFKICGINFCC